MTDSDTPPVKGMGTSGRRGILSKQPVPESERLTFRIQFAARFRARRIAISKTQPQLAAELGVSQGRIAKYEKARAVPRLDELPEICHKLGCDPNYLLSISTQQNLRNQSIANADAATLDSAEMLIAAVIARGGLAPLSNGLFAPVADYDWIELAEAYLRACDEKGVDPLVRSDPDLSSL